MGLDFGKVVANGFVGLDSGIWSKAESFRVGGEKGQLVDVSLPR